MPQLGVIFGEAGEFATAVALNGIFVRLRSGYPAVAEHDGTLDGSAQTLCQSGIDRQLFAELTI